MLASLTLTSRAVLTIAAHVSSGSGTPFFNGFRPRLRLVDSRQVGQQNVLLTYEPERA